nr:immunoglobulin light chain junction region [Macaca mulatta]
CQQFNNLPYSF